MKTINENEELVISVCQSCGSHSICHPAWILIGGQTALFYCENCSVDEKQTEHLIVKFFSENVFKKKQRKYKLEKLSTTLPLKGESL